MKQFYDFVVPPGRAAIQPELSRVYSSRSDNGALELAWSLMIE